MAEESSDVPKELIESVRDVIGRKIKISVKKKVKLETKGDKVDNKVLLSLQLGAEMLPASQQPRNDQEVTHAGD